MLVAGERYRSEISIDTWRRCLLFWAMEQRSRIVAQGDRTRPARGSRAGLADRNEAQPKQLEAGLRR